MRWYTIWGFQCYLTEETAAPLLAEEEENRAACYWVDWLSNPDNLTDPSYSDMHKAYYGTRRLFGWELD